MKDLFLRFCRWALPMLGVSAAISCDNVLQTPDMYGCPPAPEYGVPVMEYRLKGKVTDSYSGKPIPGVQVTATDAEPVYTSEDGKFTCNGIATPGDILILKFKDVDGSDNGYYVPETMEVAVERIDNGSGLLIADDILVKMDEDLPVMYGVPLAEYSVKGRVLDSDNNPIKDIEVSSDFYPYAKVRTDDDGEFLFHVDEMDAAESLTLNFTDTDGEENGGEFETKTVDVPLEQTDPGDGNWDMGDYTAEGVEIVLTRKDSED